MKDMFRLDDRNVAIIGAGSGIGEAVALGCASRGARVICLDLDAGAAGDTASQIGAAGGEAEAAELDIRDADGVQAALERIRDDHGSLDVAIATPGVNVRKPLLDYTGDEFDKVVGVNLRGSFHVLRSAGGIMAGQGKGSIVLFSSIRSQTVEPGQGVYAATKAGIVSLVRTLAAELGQDGVRVNAVAPGVVETPLTEPIKSNPDWYQAYADKPVLKRWARAEEMVGATVFLASDASSYVTGSLLFVDGGWTAADGRFQPPGM